MSILPLSAPMLEYCWLDLWEQTYVKSYSRCMHFHSWKWIWKFRLEKCRPPFLGLNVFFHTWGSSNTYVILYKLFVVWVYNQATMNWRWFTSMVSTHFSSYTYKIQVEELAPKPVVWAICFLLTWGLVYIPDMTCVVIQNFRWFLCAFYNITSIFTHHSSITSSMW